MNNIYFAQLKNNKWALEPKFLESFMLQLFELPAVSMENLSAVEVQAQPKKYNVINKTAVINVSGVLLKSVPWFFKYFGIEATGYDELEYQLSNAMIDTNIDSIHLRVSSPGGVVDGLANAADLVYSARSSKKVTAEIQDLGASAAYWLASQAQTITADRTAEVGSIGVYTVYVDSSKRAEDMGFKVHLIKSGEHKGVGVPGVEITDAQVAKVQEVINSLADLFIDSVARGRGKDRNAIKELATGELFIAKKASKVGLIDSISIPYENSNSKNNSSVNGENTMDNLETKNADLEKAKKEASAQASVAAAELMKALQAEFADDPQYAIKAFTEGKSLAEAKADYNTILRAKLEAANKKLEVKGKPAAETNGADALATETTDSGSGEGDFLAEAKQLAKDEKITVTEAMRRVRRSNMKLHQSFISKSATSGRRLVG